MNDAVLNAVQVSPSEKISFRCTGCSACCRHVRQSVVLESLDVFRITKYLRDRDSNIKSTDDFLEKHAEIALLDECGFFVFMLKVQDADDACVFLKENRCMIHSVKPRACRIYPFIASPTENGRFEYLVSKEQTHHFKGPNVSVSRWIFVLCLTSPDFYDRFQKKDVSKLYHSSGGIVIPASTWTALFWSSTLSIWSGCSRSLAAWLSGNNSFKSV